MEIKARQLEKFLNEGHKIGIVLVLRGREKYNRDWGRQRLDEFLKLISAFSLLFVTILFDNLILISPAPVV